ncbi:LOW QUALITY PROTEIN: hypothetical protein OSB04_007848, partial [Centaurea solstitialis]
MAPRLVSHASGELRSRPWRATDARLPGGLTLSSRYHVVNRRMISHCRLLIPLLLFYLRLIAPILLGLLRLPPPAYATVHRVSPPSTTSLPPPTSLEPGFSPPSTTSLPPPTSSGFTPPSTTTATTDIDLTWVFSTLHRILHPITPASSSSSYPTPPFSYSTPSTPPLPPPQARLPSMNPPHWGPPYSFEPTPPTFSFPSPTGFIPAPPLFEPPVVYLLDRTAPAHSEPESALWCVAKTFGSRPDHQEARTTLVGPGPTVKRCSQTETAISQTHCLHMLPMHSIVTGKEQKWAEVPVNLAVPPCLSPLTQVIMGAISSTSNWEFPFT